MSSHIDFRTLPASIPSVCIPRVYSNIDERRIRKTFDDLNLGIIERVDIIRKTTEKGDKCNRVFIHFSRWFSSKNADTARERLLNGQDIKIIYDDPWFWKVAAYREVAEPRSPDRRVQEPRREEYRRDEYRRDEYRRDEYRRDTRQDNNRRDERRPPTKEQPPTKERPPTKEQVDRELDRINISNGNLLAVNKPVEAPKQVITKNLIEPNDKRPGLDTDPIALDYDMAMINCLKKRVITIKKTEPTKRPPVIEDRRR